ncbi:MAG: hypothetical protein HRF45_12740 [Fimbriimonadia bacterium]
MFLLYNLLVSLTAWLWLPWAWMRSRRRAEPVRWSERMGRLRVEPGPDRIWVHAVSVGEVHAAIPVLREIRKRLPGYEILLSTTTSSGQQTARDGARDLYDHLVYFPMDVASFCLNAMIRARPKAVVIMETELWLNFLWAADVVRAKVLIANGRLSDRSYARARRFRFFYRHLLRYVHLCLMQSQTDCERIIALGADPARVRNAGNTKFDQAMAERVEGTAAREEFGVPRDVPCVVVGSTRSQEEETLVLNALLRVRTELPDLYFVLAPRHVERVSEVLDVLSERGLRAARRSHSEKGADCLLLDTFGELAKAYACADVAVVGGGFGGFGGQNIFQPLAYGKPVFFGPAMHNFRDIAELALRTGVGFRVSTSEELAEGMLSLLHSPDRLRSISDEAQRLIAANQGASERIASELTHLLTTASGEG